MSEIIYPFERGQFCCSDGDCISFFYALKEDIFEVDGDFFATCDGCGKDGIQTAQMKNLHKTLGSAKGANMSEEGKKKSRLNGFTTGSTVLSKYHEGKIPLPPAKPDKYEECDSCQDKDACFLAVVEGRGTCRPVYCHRKGEVTMKYVAAFLSGNPEDLQMLAAMNNANMQQVLNNSFRAIFERGVELVEKVIHFGAEGKRLKDELGNEYTTLNISAHPLIKQCISIMQMMGYSLSDWSLTPKSKEAKEQVVGFLASKMGSDESLEDVTDRINDNVKKFGDSLQKAAQLRNDDKTLKVFEQEEGKREADE